MCDPFDTVYFKVSPAQDSILFDDIFRNKKIKNLKPNYTLIDRVPVLSWLKILNRICKLASLDYFWTKVVVCGNLVPTNNSNK